MLKKVVAALLAAATFAPAAMAQDNDGRGDRDAGISRRGELQRTRENAGDRGTRPQFARDDNGPRPQSQPRPQQQQQQAPAFRPRPQPDQQRQVLQGRSDQGRRDWQGGGTRGDDFAARQQREQADARSRADGRVRDRSYSLPDANRPWDQRWQGRAAPVTDRARPDSSRWNGDRRFEGDRRLGRPEASWNGRIDWNRRWRDDNRYDWGRYRNQNRSVFRLPRYYAPYDWHYGYRRFAIGVTLSSLLWSQDYWIDDPWDYRLPPAYGPYRWVRYYNDALLIDIRTGYVVDTVYDIFY